MRRLDLLVPHWKETPEEMEPLLDSVAMQQGVDLSEVGVYNHETTNNCAILT